MGMSSSSTAAQDFGGLRKAGDRVSGLKGFKGFKGFEGFKGFQGFNGCQGFSKGRGMRLWVASNHLTEEDRRCEAWR